MGAGEIIIEPQELWGYIKLGTPKVLGSRITPFRRDDRVHSGR
jgi:hypothetical protein